MKIPIKYFNKECKIEQKGNWIDLKSAETYIFTYPKASILGDINFDTKLISLGIGMRLPKYFEAHIIPRSSLFLKKGIIQANHFGLIDETYSGEQDIWKFPAIALKETNILQGERICQFRIQLSMNAPWWIKLKWIFTSKIKFKEVDILTGPNRGGFGSTGL